MPLPDDDGETGARGRAPTRATTSTGSSCRMVIDRRSPALPLDQRAALVLVDMEGYPVAEVAVMLGCPTAR